MLPLAKSKVDKILLAAARLAREGHTSFAVEQLIVTAWKMFPADFSLCGFANLYPDSNRVLTYLSGPRGLRRRGLIEKADTNLLTLSAEGRRLVGDKLTLDGTRDEATIEAICVGNS